MMNSQEVWHVDVQNRIYEASYEEVIEWIKEGAILPEDKVRRGNLRWLSAGKVPEFHRYFSVNAQADNLLTAPADENNQTNEILTHFQIGAENLPAGTTNSVSPQTTNAIYLPGAAKNESAEIAPKSANADSMVCSIHSDHERFYVCQICKLYFCKTCPHSFGSSVKICLDCGGMCITYAEFEKLEDKTIGAINRPYAKIEAKNEADETQTLQNSRISKNDFFAALKYPLKFPASFLTSAVLLMILTLGQAVLAIGGINLFGLAVVISLLSVMLLFSVLTKIAENCLHEKQNDRFMPVISRFTVWEDYFHPLLFGAGAFLASFGLFICLIVGAGVYAWAQFSGELELTENQMRSTVTRVNTVVAELNEKRPNKISITEDTFEKKIEQNLQNQTERVFGSNYLGDAAELEKLIKSMLRLSIYFQTPIALTFIFGLVIFPAVCLVAGSTRSFAKTINLLRAFKIAGKVGFDYIKLLVVAIIFLTGAFFISIGTFLAFSAFEQSFAGVVVGLAVAAFTGFYSWLAFSQIIGIVIFKKRLQEFV